MNITLSTSSGFNLIWYGDNNGFSSAGIDDNNGNGYSHVVGIEDGRYRIERHQFVVPQNYNN
jgi:hypothetical protein